MAAKPRSCERRTSMSRENRRRRRGNLRTQRSRFASPKQGHNVRLFDPLGILRAASVINQYRIHSGYHYPRSPETITETLEARAEFTEAFAPGDRAQQPALLRDSEGRLADAARPVREGDGAVRAGLQAVPPGVDGFRFHRQMLRSGRADLRSGRAARYWSTAQIKTLGIPFRAARFRAGRCAAEYDFVVWATYGLGPSRGLFKIAKYQVAEKILIQLPPAAAATYRWWWWTGRSRRSIPTEVRQRSLFGSAKNTNHWTTTDPPEPIPEPYASLLNGPGFAPITFQPLRCHARGFRAGGAGIEGREVSGIAIHDPRGRKQSRCRIAERFTCRNRARAKSTYFPAKWWAR